MEYCEKLQDRFTRDARAQDQLDITTLSLQWTQLVSTWSGGWDLPGDGRAHWLLTVCCPIGSIRTARSILREHSWHFFLVGGAFPKLFCLWNLFIAWSLGELVKQANSRRVVEVPPSLIFQK